MVTITLCLHNNDVEDELVYFDSPDLEGFRHVVGSEENPIGSMISILEESIQRHVKSLVKTSHPEFTPSEYQEYMIDFPKCKYNIVLA